MEKQDFGNRLYEYRTRKGLTQKELGKLLGVTDKAVSKWETGESKPRLDKMTQITELFETSIDGMLGKEASADGEKLKPYKTIFDLRLKKYDKYYNASRILTYICAVICVLLSVLLVFYDFANKQVTFERISAIVSAVALSGAAVVLTLSFKAKFCDRSGKSISKFSVITAVLFLIPNILTALFYIRVGKAIKEYNVFSLSLMAICCLAVIITLLICVIKKKGYNAFAIVLCVLSTLEIFCVDSNYLYFLIVIYYLATQIYIHNDTNNWLALAEKAELEIKRQIRGKKSAKIFVAVIAVIVALCTVFSAFSPYFVYKILLYKFYPEGDRIKRVEYDYSAEFKEGEYYEYSFKGASLKIPNGFEFAENGYPNENMVHFKDKKNNNIISVEYFDTDHYNLTPSDFETATEEEKKLLYVNYEYKRYFGVPLFSRYGMDYYNYAVDVTDVKFYETKKAALLLMPMINQRYLRQSTVIDRAAVYNNGEYCGFVSCSALTRDGEPSRLKHRLADVWHVYDLEGAYYHILYVCKDGTDEEAHQMICKIVNSLEF